MEPEFNLLRSPQATGCSELNQEIARRGWTTRNPAVSRHDTDRSYAYPVATRGSWYWSRAGYYRPEGDSITIASSNENGRQDAALLMFAEPLKSVLAEKAALTRKQSRGPCHYE